MCFQQTRNERIIDHQTQLSFLLDKYVSARRCNVSQSVVYNT